MLRNKDWVPVDGQELWSDRGWTVEEVERRLDSGNLEDIVTETGRHIFESPQQHKRYLRMRKRPPAEYAKWERAHALDAGVPYRPFIASRYDDKEETEGMGTQAVRLVKAIWVILQILVLPFTIMGMRDGAQWFLGTGDHAKGDDDF